MSSDTEPFNRRLFRDDNNLPIKFFIHPDVKKKDTRNVLTQNIKKYGGRVIEQKEDANTILVPTGQANKFRAAYKFSGSANQSQPFVEEVTFIGHCIRWNKVSHRIPEIKGMGGPRIGRGRVPFTESDDENLCKYIAVVLPEKDSGGRMGLEMYQTLCDTAISEPVNFAWAARHTKESWKQRYKMHREDFDRRIDRIIASNEIHQPQNLLGRDRRIKAGRKRYYEEDDEENDRDFPPSPERVPEREEIDEDEENAPPSPPRASSIPSSPESGPASRKRRMEQSQTSKGKQRAVVESDEGSRSEGNSLFSDNADNIYQDDFFDTIPEPVHPALPGSDLSIMDKPNQPSPAVRKTLRTNETDFASPAQRFSQQKSHVPSSSSPARDSQYYRNSLLQSSPPPINSPNFSVQNNRSQDIVARNAPNSSYQRPKKAARRPKVLAPQPSESHVPYVKTSSRTGKLQSTATEGGKIVIKEEPDVVRISDDEHPEQGAPVVEVEEEEEDNTADVITVGRTHMRRVSLDTDDAQIVSTLQRAKPRQSRPSSSFGADRIRPSDILKEYEETDESMTSRYSRHGLLDSSPTSAPFLASIGGEGSLRQSQAFKLDSQDPRTPKQSTRIGSVSNDGSDTSNFPILGTKARVFKKNLTQMAKKTPYTPPDGTRAARFIRDR